MQINFEWVLNEPLMSHMNYFLILLWCFLIIFCRLKGKFSQKWKSHHHFLTLTLFQICLTFFLMQTIKRYFEKCWEPDNIGAHWLPLHESSELSLLFTAHVHFLWCTWMNYLVSLWMLFQKRQRKLKHVKRSFIASVNCKTIFPHGSNMLQCKSQFKHMKPCSACYFNIASY